MDMSKITDVGQLSAEDFSRYSSDDAYRLEVDNSIKRNKNVRRGAGEVSTTTSVQKSGIYEHAATDVAPVTRAKPLRSHKYPAAEQSTLLKAMLGATATKVREMSMAERDVKFDGLCDELGVPEDRDSRQTFYYSVIAWITMNTASTENGVDSTVGGEYSSQRMLEFFDYDLRPFARALAPDAKTFISFVVDTREHPLHDPILSLARKFGVPKTAYLIYDGIGGAKITEGESRIAEEIKVARLNGDGVATPTQTRSNRGTSSRGRGGVPRE